MRRPGSHHPLMVERIAVLVLLFTASGTSAIARSYMTWDSPVGVMLLGISCLALIFTHKIGVDRRLVALLMGYFLLFAVQLLWYESFHPKHLLLYPVSFCIAYVYLRSMQVRFFNILEDVIAWLSICALAVWVVDVLSAGKLRSALSGINLLSPYDDIIDSYVFIYTVVLEGVESYLPRNAGFAWEPGAFAVFNCIGLVINLARTSFKVRNNRRAQLFIVAILSSQSTTGYSILLAILLAKAMVGVKGAARLVVVPVVISVIAVALTLPFMQDKILELWDQDVNELAASASESWNIDKPVAAQRFLSLKLDMDDFLENPILGYGGRESEMGIRKQNLNIVTISGIGKIPAKFGFFGLAFFIVSLVMSSSRLAERLGCESRSVLAIVLLCIAVSYSLIEHPILMCFWLYWNFVPKLRNARELDGLREATRQVTTR